MIDPVANLAQLLAYEHRCTRQQYSGERNVQGPCSWCRALADRTLKHVRTNR